MSAPAGGGAAATAALFSMLATASDEAGKVVKKQKTCEAKVDACLEQLIKLVQRSRDQLAEAVQALNTAELQGCHGGDQEMVPSSNFAQQVVCELKRRLEELNASKDMNAHVKELHSSINKLSKPLAPLVDNDKVDLCKALRRAHMDRDALNKIIASHLFREGRWEVGEAFAAEAGLVDARRLRAPYQEMHAVLEQLRARSLGPALQWVSDARARLPAGDGPTTTALSALEFKLHTLAFITALTTQGQPAALTYARSHLSRFAPARMPEVQRLMGCLLYAGRPGGLGGTPYAELVGASRWEEAAGEFMKVACGLIGQACESPLAVSVAAGAAALPALLKLAAVMEKNLQELSSCDELPVEIELGNEFVFHSIFSCPVSREAASADNPALLLPCNHVLCEQSVLRIAKSRVRSFKCPYCPVEARPDALKPLHLMDD